MAYHVEITLTEPAAPGEDPSGDGPTRLEPAFETLEDARAGAEDAVEALNLPSGGATYRIVTSDGRQVEPPLDAPAGPEVDA